MAKNTVSDGRRCGGRRRGGFLGTADPRMGITGVFGREGDLDFELHNLDILFQVILDPEL